MISSEFLQKSPNCEWAYSGINIQNIQYLFCIFIEKRSTINFIVVSQFLIDQGLKKMNN